MYTILFQPNKILKKNTITKAICIHIKLDEKMLLNPQ